MRTFTLFLSVCALAAVSANAQYCMLPGRTAYSSLQPGITNFKLNAINRTSSNVEQALSLPPIVVTTDTTTLTRGQTYTIYLTHSEDYQFFPGARNNVRVWIDYNKDYDFIDAGETVASHDLEAPGTTDTLTFTVPMTAPLGYTRLRATAKMSADAGHTLPTSCDVPADPLDYHGEMEDYTVRIADPVSVNEVSNGNTVISIHPNPTGGKLTITSTEAINTISISDLSGKEIARIAANKSSVAIDLNEYGLSQGVYLIKAGNAPYMKLVKMN